MKTISSKGTRFQKKVFPILWFGSLAFFFAAGFSTGAVQQAPQFAVLPIVMVAVGFLVMKKMLWDLADEVRDGGDYLIVTKGGEEERIPLSNIMNVSYSLHQKPRRVTLRLAHPSTKFGNEIAFTPASSITLNPFAKNEVVEDLIVRVDRARSRRDFGPKP